ncbi:30S ribosomal protein S9 [Blattabacterium cuenoti]|uniref:30S ribosomal protein S9 n=1 Tax=Blattabacterium cuenoti TaxID=1653831 RepID=UPI00163C90CE|nr:30S ribosomal protein S9 [Blattabacterium cuenoti]
MKIHAIGRRKRSLARIYLQYGNGKIIINSINYKKYFSKYTQNKILHPFQLFDYNNKFNIDIKVIGGGYNGQAEAISLAISRALCMLDTNHKELLKKYGLLTRDSREVERKKFGQKKARKQFQFSKR